MMKLGPTRWLHILERRISRIISYDQGNGRTIPSFRSLPVATLLRRVLIIFLAIPFSIIIWGLLVIISRRRTLSIYVLRNYRPGFASTYLSQIEPLCRGLQLEPNRRGINILIDAGQTINNELLKIYEPHFSLYLDDRRPFFRQIAFLIPGLWIHRYSIKPDVFNKGWTLPPVRIFRSTPEGWIPPTLKNLGITPKNFVCFAHSSRGYYSSKMDVRAIEELSPRFIDLSSYGDALRRLNELGLVIVRVGTDVDDLPESICNIPFVDYTGQIRNEADELWLFENCLFLLSAGNGAWWFAHKFGRPTLITDNYFIIDGYQSTLFTPRILWSQTENRPLSFGEQLRLKDTSLKSQLADLQLTLIENSPQTICNATAEMYSFTQRGHSYSKSDLDLLRRWNNVFESSRLRIQDENMTRPCITFLREHEHLIR